MHTRSDRPTPTQDAQTGRRPRLGWLTQDNAILPLPEVRGSIDNDVAQLSRRLAGRYEIVMGTRPHSDYGPDPVLVDGIRYVRADVAADEARRRRIHRLNQIQRALRLPDLPYTGRSSYFRGYAHAHAAHFAAAGVDIVHLHNYSQWVPTLRRALPDAPIVLQMHCEWLAEIPYAQGLERLRLVDRVLGVARHVADQVRDRFPELAHKVDVLPNGMDLEEFPGRRATRSARAAELAATRAQLGLGPGPVILFVGRISAEKGLHHLLAALPRVLHAVPGAQALLCGPFAGLRSPLATRERRELRRHPEWRARYPEYLRTAAAPFGDQVIFPGRIAAKDLPLVFALADVAVQPSLFEAFPLSLIEAMASEVPVVATRAGGMPEQVVHGETGLLVPTEDPAALAEALVSVLGDPDRAVRMGLAGRERVANTFTWDRSAERLDAIYRELLGERAAHGAG